MRIHWAAIDTGESTNIYSPDVHWRIRQLQPSSYRQAAEEINASPVDIVNVQHEFGLYGVWGDDFDDHLAPFLESLRKPLVTTLHSVPPDPSPSVRAAVRRIGRRSHVVVGMAELARNSLVERYGLDPAGLRVIPHGVPAVRPRGRRWMKERLSLQGRPIVLTFGLVDPRKGLEYMIGAMERVASQHPNALYVIAGKTHPELIRQEGERYRRELHELVRLRGLEQNVAFVDRYLTQSQIVDYLLACDAYVTPYLDPNQITSGTLAYALGSGKAIVSTPYLHAVEVLDQGRGLLVDFRSEGQLADGVLKVLDDPWLKQRLERNAYAYGSETAWPRIAERMLTLFRAAAGDWARPYCSTGSSCRSRLDSRASPTELDQPIIACIR